jgi:hypothetical protein
MTDNQHKADLDRVSQQNSFTDLARGLEEQPRGGGLVADLVIDPLRAVVEATPYGKAMHGRTCFEHYDLNQMLDLVEQTDPEDLESSGRALWDARDAIKAAATELSGHIERVHWAGESGDAFRDWGQQLVKNTHALSDFAGGAGDQITAAAAGLASVRAAMPPRDQRAVSKSPKEFPKAEQIDGNSAYTAAVQVEKHRQEAINQMNRLSSYYSVSAEQLKGWQGQAPEFQDMPDVGVPQPAPVSSHPSRHSSRSLSTDGGSHMVQDHHTSVAPGDHAIRRAWVDSTEPGQRIPPGTSQPDVPVGTNIDTVGTLPPPAAPMTEHAPTSTSLPGVGGGPNNTFVPGYGTSIPTSVPGRGAGGVGGFRPPAPAQGRAGTAGASSPGAGRSPGRVPANQMGRATPTGQPAVKGTTSGDKPSPMARAVSGGTPRVGGSATPRLGAGRANGAGPATGAGRANGVVGGRPTSAAGPTSKGGTRSPRGTVVGAEGTVGSRPVAGGLGQRGVFGVSGPSGQPAAGADGSRGGAAANEAVTGRPATRNSAVRAERNGMTRGGTGLVRGLGNQGKPGDRTTTGRSQRPAPLAEDEETQQLPKSRRDVPSINT